MLCESCIAEDKAKKENTQYCETNRRSLEYQVKAVTGGRKVNSRFVQKIKDLESQFDEQQDRLVEAEKSQRRTTRRIKELTFSQEEDHKVFTCSFFVG